MKEKGMSKGEFSSVAQANGGLDGMINWDGKDKDDVDSRLMKGFLVQRKYIKEPACDFNLSYDTVKRRIRMGYYRKMPENVEGLNIAGKKFYKAAEGAALYNVEKIDEYLEHFWEEE